MLKRLNHLSSSVCLQKWATRLHQRIAKILAVIIVCGGTKAQEYSDFELMTKAKVWPNSSLELGSNFLDTFAH